MINVGDTVRVRTANGITRKGQVVYVHRSNTWYTAHFSCPDGQSYSESFWSHQLKDDYDDPAIQAERIKESQRQSVLRREFRYGL